jgi:hypothetical protein
MQVAHDLVAEATSLSHNPFESGGGQIFRLIIRDVVSRIEKEYIIKTYSEFAGVCTSRRFAELLR